jgi:hypothetical protein
MIISVWSFAGLPDSGSWFIQQLTGVTLSGGYNLDVSDSVAVWEGNEGVCYYDGTGTYILKYNSFYCYAPRASGTSIVCATNGGIVYNNRNVKKLISNGKSYYNFPDVYQNYVVWEGGNGSDYNETDIYLNDGVGTVCLTDIDLCWYNGNSPKISREALAWRSFDGNDHDIFLLHNGFLRQLTSNDVEDYEPFLSDNGHAAWVTEHGYGWHVHYFDGQYTWQLTMGGGGGWICGISDDGVLYGYEENQHCGLYYFDGTDVELLFEGDYSGEWNGSIGGGSIAWSAGGKIYFRKNGQTISWANGDVYMTENVTGVWGNRIVWRNYDDWNLYFAEYLGNPVCTHPLKMDSNHDCKVDLADYMQLAAEWLRCGYNASGSCQ